APARARAQEPGRRRLAVNPRAGGERRLREPTRVGEGVYRAAPAIEPAAPVFVRPQQARDRGRVEDLDRCAESRPLLRPRCHELDIGSGMRALDPTVSDPWHIHAMLLDEVEDDVGGAACEFDQPLPTLGTVHADDLVGVEFEARYHLASSA